MRIKDLMLFEAKGPARIPTGKGAVVNPAHMPTSKYEGDPAGYDWKRQKAYYDAISAALARNGKRLEYIGVATAPFGVGGDVFVATAPNFVWQKQDSSGQGNPNWLWINGTKMKLKQFLALTPAEQDEMLSGAADPSEKDWELNKNIKGYIQSLKRAGLTGEALKARVNAKRGEIMSKLSSEIYQASSSGNPADASFKALRSIGITWPDRTELRDIIKNIIRPRMTDGYYYTGSFISQIDAWLHTGLISKNDSDMAKFILSVCLQTNKSMMLAITALERFESIDLEFIDKRKAEILDTINQEKDLFKAARALASLKKMGVTWPEIDSYLDDKKKPIIRGLLDIAKRGFDPREEIKFLRSKGIVWPELNAIEAAVKQP